MTTKAVVRGSGTLPDSCSIVIVHETPDVFEWVKAQSTNAIEVWNRHMQVEVSDWSLDSLMDQERAQEAMAGAATADILVLGLSAAGHLPGFFQDWAAGWLARRAGREGTIVGLVFETEPESEARFVRESELHHLALQAGMDYLSRFPDTPIRGIPDLTDWCAMRAGAQSGVLEQILRREPGLGA